MANDLIGKRYGKLTVMEQYGRDKIRNILWKCKCDCGGEVITSSHNLNYGLVMDCGCSYKSEDLTGKRFGHIEVIKRLPNTSERKFRTTVMWLCKCDCGETLEIKASDLTQKRMISCGCHKNKKALNMAIKQNKDNMRLYYIYIDMKRRCNNPNDQYYIRYGGRGIKVCDEWNDKYGFASFYEWAINNGYANNLTLDRIDNDGNYEPSNCRWATHKEQSNNTSFNVKAEYRGEVKSLAEWASQLNLNPNTIYYHYHSGKTIEEIVFFFEQKRAKREISINKVYKMA